MTAAFCSLALTSCSFVLDKSAKQCALDAECAKIAEGWANTVRLRELRVLRVLRV